MASIVRRETRERTVVGKLIKWAFIAFNIAMIIWIVGGLTAASKIQVHSAVEQAGLAIGSAIGVASLLILWAIGDIILGILVLFSRGDKIITEEIAGGFTASGQMAERPSGDFGKADELIAHFKAQKSGSDVLPAPHTAHVGAAATFGKRR
ncbi:MAG TPA: hypothetical protein VN838_06855 [Bradyrhizobium sp.]|nr:hypothetical protein [Bradyrhizobium sp.]